MKVIYGVKLIGIKNNRVAVNYTTYKYESDIIDISPIDNNSLIEEIIQFYKDSKMFKDCNSINIELIYPSHQLIQLNNKEEAFKELYEASINIWDKVKTKTDIQYQNRLYKTIIDNILFIRDKTKELNLLDSQDYLNFLDTLNKLSIDQDRDDSN